MIMIIIITKMIHITTDPPTLVKNGALRTAYISGRSVNTWSSKLAAPNQFSRNSISTAVANGVHHIINIASRAGAASRAATAVLAALFVGAGDGAGAGDSLGCTVNS